MTDTGPARRPEDVGLRLGVLSDIHLADPGAEPTAFNNPVRRGESEQFLRAALDWLTPRVDALVLLGDLADEPRAASYRRLARALAGAAQPVFALLGNHDLPNNPAAPAPAFAALAGVAEFPGRTRLGRHVLTSGPLARQGEAFRQFAALPAPPVSPDAAPPDGADLLIWAAHFPALSLRAQISRCDWLYAGDLANRAEVAHTLAHWPGPVLALSGHLHVRAHAISGNTLQLVCGALAEAPCEAAVVEVAPARRGLRVARWCRTFAPARRAEFELGATLDRQFSAFRWERGRWRTARPTPLAPRVATSAPELRFRPKTP
ncbi:MAG: metallophosphoesterase [Bifidobacteriaceae bacterium]|jgi:hypothetical protein|nr:metallophosphoesterase [Bifidobacteriaceae bacterium]